MTWGAQLSLLVTAGMVFAMVRNLAGPDMILLAGMAVLLATGVLTPEEAFAGFSNIGMLTIAVMFVVSTGVQQTGGLDFLVSRMLGNPRNLPLALARMMLPVSGMSAFLNNTPVVAMMIPVISDWAKRIQVSPSKLLIPLSYASIVGGSCTLIGTATNLVVVGMAFDHDPSMTFGMFEIGLLGGPVALVGIAYSMAAARYLLPSREATTQDPYDRAREYTVAMRVQADSPLVGTTIEGAGLRQLPGLFLIDIESENGTMRPAPGPGERLYAGDRLVFAGIIDSIVDLQKMRGLVPAESKPAHDPAPANRRLVEAVVAPQSSLLHRSVREAGFRTRYGAAIIAVQRQGQRIRSKVGDIVLQAGDTLLLSASAGFAEAYRNDPTFALVSEVENSEARRHERSYIAIGLLLGMVIASALGFVPLITAGLMTAGLMILTHCLTADQARRALDMRVLVTIAAAFAIGHALTKTGAASSLAALLIKLAAPLGDLGLLAALYSTTVLLSAVITNSAAATLMFPISLAVSDSAALPLKPVLYLIMLAASASFTTPIGYQTNLMVYGPGRYRFADFTRFGLPLQVITGVVTVGLVKWLWLS